MTWAQVITLGVAIIGAMWALFRWGLKGELGTLESKIEAILEKVGKVDKHEADIKEIQTVMKMNGCMSVDGPAFCRRKGDA